MLWFTADPHFNHKRIIELSHRPWASVEEMNEALIDRWNTLVEATDEVYVLGDFAFWYKGAQPLDEIHNRLNGTKHLVVGNHDEQNTKVLRLPWATQSQIAHIRYGEARFIACHFPLARWWHQERGVLHVHGHCHGALSIRQAHRFDVGVDAQPWYAPVTAVDIIEAAADQPFEPKDYHV